MKFFTIVILSILSFTFLNKVVLAGEPLVNYNFLYITDPVTKLRVPDSDPRAINGIDGLQSFTLPGRSGKSVTSVILDPNSPKLGNQDDCYPDDPNNPKGNIVLSGRLISNFTNQPINGAVVAVYMGAEQLSNIPEGFGNNEEFLHGGKDYKGRLTNLYTYDISKDGYFRVYACNDYKQLSTERINTLKENSPYWFSDAANGPCKLEGYTGNSGGCTHFDYVKAYPKFSLAVVCGLYQTSDPAAPAPQIGEVLSIDNYNDEYKSANPPSYMYKENLDIRVNCEDNISAFPVPFRLDFDSPTNVSSCRLDTISPNLRNYFLKVKEPLKNDFYSLDRFTIPGSTLIPDDTALSCSNPDDIFCLKNFLSKSFPKPENGKNIYDYGNKNYLDITSVNPNLKNKSLSYDTKRIEIKSDLTYNTPTGNDYIALTRDSTYGQADAKVDLKSSISDYKFDLNVLKELYGCFTTFNSPAKRSNAFSDEQNIRSAATNIIKEYEANNLRIPSCRELYCGSEFVPDNRICKVQKPAAKLKEEFGFDFSVDSSEDNFYQINALSGYGPGVTLSFKSLEEITNDFLVLSKELINSDFNPKKPIAGATLNYKPVSKVSDIVACLDDQNNPVYLNDSVTGNQKEGSITYKTESGQEVTFFSPVPLLSYISVPFTMELYHAIEGDNYANFNKSDPSTQLLFPEQCNPGKPFVFGGDSRYDQQFANCRRAVIPGGVYSVSALRVISKYCTDAFKIPTPDSANLPKASPITAVKPDSRYNLSSLRDSLEIDLSITKVGTPLSMCLCSMENDSCSFNERLNNVETTDFAISSFVGAGDQNFEGDQSINALGFKCEAKAGPIKEDGKKRDSTNCFGKNDDGNYDGSVSNVKLWVIKNSPENNFIGPSNNNLQVTWEISQQEIQDPAVAEKYLSYTWGNKNRYNGNFQIFKTSDGGLTYNGVSLSPDNKLTGGTVRCKVGATDPATGEAFCSEPLAHPSIGLQVGNAEHISLQENLSIEYTDESQVAESTLLTSESGPRGDYVTNSLKIVQITKQGNIGLAQSKYQVRNAKYDPIPDLLNDFRRYSVMGFMAGDYCKAPKIGAVVDIQTNLLNTTELAKTDIYDTWSNDNHTAGIHCNAAIPEELERCDDPENWILPAYRDEAAATGRTIPEHCRVIRCLHYCFQMTGVNEAVTRLQKDGVTGSERQDIFCKNPLPTKNIEFQVNQSDEGCILESVTRMKQAYANPAEIDIMYQSAFGNQAFDKERYPVYNNMVCYNPALNNPALPGYEFDNNNCRRNVYDAASEARKFMNQGEIRVPITIP